MLLKIILIVLVLNSTSFIIVNWSHLLDKGVRIETIRSGVEGGEAVYLVGGCQCRTIEPFRCMLGVVPEDTAIYLVEYLNSGFYIERAATLLWHHLRDNKHKKATFITVSLGYQLAVRATRRGDKIIALNPCIGKDSLSPKLQRAIVALPIVYVVSVLLGWLSYAPIVKINGSPWYSLTLLEDQFAICANNDTLTKCPFEPDVLVLSRRDEVLCNKSILCHLANSPRVYIIDANHFGLEDNSHLFYRPVAESIRPS